MYYVYSFLFATLFLPTISACLMLLQSFFFFKQKTAYGTRISDWSSDVCSSDLPRVLDWHSTPWGVVSLTEHIGEADSARARRAAYARMREIVAESMAPFAARLPGGLRQPRLLGTSGTVTQLAR